MNKSEVLCEVLDLAHRNGNSYKNIWGKLYYSDKIYNCNLLIESESWKEYAKEISQELWRNAKYGDSKIIVSDGKPILYFNSTKDYEIPIKIGSSSLNKIYLKDAEEICNLILNCENPFDLIEYLLFTKPVSFENRKIVNG